MDRIMKYFVLSFLIIFAFPQWTLAEETKASAVPIRKAIENIVNEQKVKPSEIEKVKEFAGKIINKEKEDLKELLNGQITKLINKGLLKDDSNLNGILAKVAKDGNDRLEELVKKELGDLYSKNESTINKLIDKKKFDAGKDLLKKVKEVINDKSFKELVTDKEQIKFIYNKVQDVLGKEDDDGFDKVLKSVQADLAKVVKKGENATTFEVENLEKEIGDLNAFNIEWMVNYIDATNGKLISKENFEKLDENKKLESFKTDIEKIQKTKEELRKKRVRSNYLISSSLGYANTPSDEGSTVINADAPESKITTLHLDTSQDNRCEQALLESGGDMDDAGPVWFKEGNPEFNAITGGAGALDGIVFKYQADWVRAKCVKFEDELIKMAVNSVDEKETLENDVKRLNDDIRRSLMEILSIIKDIRDEGFDSDVIDRSNNARLKKIISESSKKLNREQLKELNKRKLKVKHHKNVVKKEAELVKVERDLNTHKNLQITLKKIMEIDEKNPRNSKVKFPELEVDLKFLSKVKGDAGYEDAIKRQELLKTFRPEWNWDKEQAIYGFKWGLGLESDRKFDKVNFIGEVGFVPMLNMDKADNFLEYVDYLYTPLKLLQVFTFERAKLGKNVEMNAFLQGGYKSEIANEQPMEDVSVGQRDESDEALNDPIFRFKVQGKTELKFTLIEEMSKNGSIASVVETLFGAKVEEDIKFPLRFVADATGWQDFMNGETYHRVKTGLIFQYGKEKTLDLLYESGSGAPNFNQGEQISTNLKVRF